MIRRIEAVAFACGMTSREMWFKRGQSQKTHYKDYGHRLLFALRFSLLRESRYSFMLGTERRRALTKLRARK
jgi:hypothetical protein